ncbi:hypothetical protein D8X85_02575 [Listeria seeligeri]|nr:hypothetical protein [Listeria seeligeri]MBM5676106.1 hypothetical protein [Listeria seeligeri]
MQAFIIPLFQRFAVKLATSVNYFSFPVHHWTKMTIFCYKKEFIVLFKMQDKTLFQAILWYNYGRNKWRSDAFWRKKIL